MTVLAVLKLGNHDCWTSEVSWLLSHYREVEAVPAHGERTCGRKAQRCVRCQWRAVTYTSWCSVRAEGNSTLSAKLSTAGECNVHTDDAATGTDSLWTLLLIHLQLDTFIQIESTLGMRGPGTLGKSHVAMTLNTYMQHTAQQQL